MPLRTKLDFIDARSGAEYHGPCKLILDLPEPVRFVTKGFSAEAAAHNGQPFRRYVIPCNRGNLEDFYLQAASPTGRGRLYLYGDSGQGPENEREVAWEALVIPAARQPKRLHVSLAWSNAEFLYDTWPDYLGAMKHLGFNCVACFPRYWREADVPKCQAVLQKARDAGFRIIVNESPAGALEEDRSQPETQSRLPGGPSGHVCPSYRGQFYRKEQASFGQHAVWCRPDYVFYDIEAYWDGAQEAPRCTRCRERFQQGGPKDWDDFRAAMGREMHLDMKAAIDQAMAAAGLAPRITYGSYRTEPITPLNDGLFRWDNLYPDLVQIAMPSLYVAGNQLAVAESISANRARLKANDIIPWLSTATYGEYEPVRTRDMVLETFANGARGVTYYWYGDFDPAHFRYHAEAIDMVAPVEDLFVDGAPLTELKSNHPQVKLCGMGLGGELAVLVSNYNGLPPTERVKVYAPVARRSPVWDLHTGKKIGEVGPGEAFTVTLGDLGAHLLYLGTKYAQAVAK
jgi:hypothetical protein